MHKKGTKSRARPAFLLLFFAWLILHDIKKGASRTMRSENLIRKRNLSCANSVVFMLKGKKKLSLRLLSLILSLLVLFPLGLLPAAAAAGSPLFFSFSPTKEQKSEKSELLLLPGGQSFGVRLQSAGVLVVSLSEVTCGGRATHPAREAGLRARDIILTVDGASVEEAEQLTALISASGGRAMTLGVLRGKERLSLTLHPQKSDKSGSYAAGMYIRDSASGIGTVTFIMPDCGIFGGLGHGVCDSDTGALLPLSRGNVLSVAITGVARGEKGKPGELCGSFTGRRIGSIVTNSACGVFGLLNETPACTYGPTPTGHAAVGEATILCTLGEDGVGEYKVEITRLNGGDGQTKSFCLRVTDERLLARTGGIVQGMSGSPILQNGRIVGAVTHVMVDDPTAGYGIFIENMLSAMKMRAVA